MRLYLGDVRNDIKGYQSLAEFADTTKSLANGTVQIDLGSCTFFYANMAAVLGPIVDGLWVTGNEVRFINVNAKVQRILSKNKFLDSYGFPPEEDLNHTTLKYKNFILKDNMGFQAYLRSYLPGKGLPRMTPLLYKAFLRNLLEIFQNCQSHSQSQYGVYVCGQFFPKKNTLDLTIADAGVGIRTNVRQFLGRKISSIDAMKWAMDASNSTRKNGQPGGLGLKLLRQFIAKNGGKIQIVSRYGYYEFSGGNEKFQKMAGDLPGTTVNVEINTADETSYCLTSELTQKNVF